MNKNIFRESTIGIDASNIRQGGGITHLIELFEAFDINQSNIKKVVIWGPEATLSQIPTRTWIEKKSPLWLNKSILLRIIWILFFFKKSLFKSKCNVLFVPGGTVLTSYYPTITMCQNMLPFTSKEIRRLGISFGGLRLRILRFLHTRSFRRAEGVIFLTLDSLNRVIADIGPINARTAVIPHGINEKFLIPPRTQLSANQYNNQRPIKIAYVSSVAPYKHQKEVVEAIHLLRLWGYPVFLRIIGPGRGYYLKDLKKLINKYNNENIFIEYAGSVNYLDMKTIYEDIDIAVFASTCEAQAIILLEKMAAGLPIACSNRGSMSEILGGAGIYFNSEDPQDIARAIEKYINSTELRTGNIKVGRDLVKDFQWSKTASLTFNFLDSFSNA